jgi:hypothetical protein
VSLIEPVQSQFVLAHAHHGDNRPASDVHGIMEHDFAPRYVLTYPGVNSRTDLVPLLRVMPRTAHRVIGSGIIIEHKIISFLSYQQVRSALYPNPSAVNIVFEGDNYLLIVHKNVLIFCVFVTPWIIKSWVGNYRSCMVFLPGFQPADGDRLNLNCGKLGHH